MKRIVGLTGLAGSGKTTVAHWLIGRFDFEPFAFADPLKDGVATMLGIPREWMDDQERKQAILPQYGCTLRHVLQTIGTEWGRRCVHEDIWLIRAREILSARKASTVIHDVRFGNEAVMVRSMGVLVHVVRDGHAGLDGSAGRHVSEAGVRIAPEDIVIHNCGDLDDLHAVLEYQFRFLKSKVRTCPSRQR